MGLALGVTPSSMSALGNWLLSEPPVPLSVGNVFEIMVLTGSIVAFLLLAYVMRNKGADAHDLVKAIRERTKQQV